MPHPALIAAMLVTLAACGDPAPLRIVVVGGAGAPAAAALAVEDVNAAGGIRGRVLELGVVTEPLNVTPQHAIATADSLASIPGVLAVIGHGGSATSLAASQVYNTRHVPQIAPSTSTPLYSRAGAYSFRLVASDEHQAEFIAHHVTTNASSPRVALLYVNDDYGRALVGFVRAELGTRGTRAVLEAPYIAGAAFAPEMPTIVASLVASNPDLVVWLGLSPELLQLRAALRRALPRARVFGSDGISFIAAAPDLAPFEGDWLVAYTDVDAERPELVRVRRRFLPLADRPLNDVAALTYDAVSMIAQAMREGATSRQDIQRYLRDGAAAGRTYNGITGTIQLDENGDARPSYVLLEVSGGRVRPKTP